MDTAVNVCPIQSNPVHAFHYMRYRLCTRPTYVVISAMAIANTVRDGDRKTPKVARLKIPIAVREITCAYSRNNGHQRNEIKITITTRELMTLTKLTAAITKAWS